MRSPTTSEICTGLAAAALVIVLFVMCGFAWELIDRGEYELGTVVLITAFLAFVFVAVKAVGRR
jgi:hypothetical protein